MCEIRVRKLARDEAAAWPRRLRHPPRSLRSIRGINLVQKFMDTKFGMLRLQGRVFGAIARLHSRPPQLRASAGVESESGAEGVAHLVGVVAARGGCVAPVAERLKGAEVSAPLGRAPQAPRPFASWRRWGRPDSLSSM